MSVSNLLRQHIYFLICLIFILSLVPILYDVQRINADSLTSVYLAKDILSKDLDLQDWTLPPAPAFFSEVLGVGFFYSVTKNVILTFFLNTALQAAIIFYLLIQLTIKSYPQKIAQVTIGILAFVCVLHFGVVNENVWVYSYANNLHMGTLLFLLPILIQRTQCSISNWDIKKNLSFIGLATLSVLDSKTTLTIFLIPLFILDMLDKANANKRFKISMIYSLIIFLSTTTSIFLFGTEQDRIFALFDFDKVKYALQVSFEYSKIQMKEYNSYYVSMAVFFAFITLFLSYLVIQSRWKKSLQNKMLTQMVFLILIGSLLSLLLLAASAKLVIPRADSRFFILPLTLCLWLFLCYLPIQEIKPKATFVFLCLMAIGQILYLFHFWNPNYSIKDVLAERTPFSPLVQCLQNEFANSENKKIGISEYWLAKPLRFFSNSKFAVTQVDFELNDFHFMDKKTWHKENEKINFIIESPFLTEASILKKYGPALKILPCPETSINYGTENNSKVLKVHIYSYENLIH